jgi:hypothetical protein
VPTSARAFAVQAADAVVPARFERAAQQARTSLLEALALPPEVSAALAGQTVHVEPSETSVVHAVAGVRWAPLPLFQAFSVWSSAQDQRNVAVLQGPGAPTLILREALFRGKLPGFIERQLGRPLAPGEQVPATVDGRSRWFEEPATTLEILCRYRERISTARWQVLDRTSGSCGPPEPLSVITAREGETVTVPVESRPGRFVIVRVHGIEPGLLTQAQISLWKGPEWYVTVGTLRYRLVPGTATDGLLLAVPPAADGTGTFAFGPPFPTIAIQTGLREPGGHNLTYEFFSVPLLAAGSAP